MIDDERLQDLLAKASSLYNNGEYRGAIDAWREALGVDPQSQKAREGIRMATLLVGDADQAATGPGVVETTAEEELAPADGAEAEEAQSPEEVEAKLALGIARVKQLIAQRKYSEAIEGARGLLPIDPQSEELNRLLEDARQAFEATPFIQEHLTLARELMAQERFPEAEVECRKIFTLDATHPAARTLLAQIRDKIQGHLKRAADQLGGMTVKLSAPDLVAMTKRGARPAAGKPAAAAPGAPGVTKPTPGFTGEFDLEGAEERSIPLAAGPSKDSAAAASQEEVASRNALEAAFEQAGVSDEPAAPAPGSDQDDAAAPAFEGLELSPSIADAAAPSKSAPEVVEAETVVEPSVRMVPRAPSAPGASAAEPATSRAAASKTGSSGAAAAQPSPQASKQAGGSVKPGGGGKPVAPASDGGKPASAAPKPAPAPRTPPPDETAWENELAQLNIKQGERDFLRGTAAKVSTAPAGDQADADLMSFLDTDLGAMPGPPEGAAPAASQSAGGKPSVDGAAPGKSEIKLDPQTVGPARSAKETQRAEIKGRESASPATRERPAERPRVAPVAPRRERSSAGKWLFMLGLLLLGGGAAWWFLFQPRSAGGFGWPGQPAPPPAGSSSGPVASQSHTAIPTPIGSTSRQPSQDPQGASGGDGAAIAPEPSGAPPQRGAPPQAAAAAGAPTGAASGSPAGGGGPIKPPEAVKPPEPIKPQAPTLSPAEIHQKVAAFAADGKHLAAQGKWREARAKLSAALALDPANISVKDVLDMVQTKIDEDQHLQDDFDSVKRAFADKDYENALRKLYRLPRDKGLGDIDRYIRNAWFNWAVIGMKAGNATDALKKLQELLDVDPDDAEALKLQEVAEHYVSRAKDRVYYAFTDTLKLREIEQR